MSLHPDQQRALDYLRRKGTEAPLDTLRAKAEEGLRRFEERLRTVPEELRARRPAPGKWSVHEVVDHLVATNRPALEELRSLLSGKRPESGPIPAGLTSADPFARSWSEAVADLEDLHGRFLALLDTASEDADLTVRAPLVMVVKVDGKPVEWSEELDWKMYAAALRAHTLEHLAQVERTLAAVQPNLGH